MTYEELEKFKNMSREEQKEYLYDNGDLELDSYRVNSIGEITDISIVGC